MLKSYLASNSKNARHSRKKKYNQRIINGNSANTTIGVVDKKLLEMLFIYSRMLKKMQI